MITKTETEGTIDMLLTKTRLSKLKVRRDEMEEKEDEEVREYKKFIALGRQLFKTPEGKQFIYYVKKFFLKENEDLRDSFFENNR
jgi:hypothetical protein